jgi:dolichyl-phosphate beta-glucosyltransferase
MLNLSVVIPAYNEESRLPPTLASVHYFLSEYQANFEIIIVDDGSTDATASMVKEFAAHHDSVRLISYRPNRGKGYAIRTGVLAANRELILINDADGSSPIEEIVRLEWVLQKGADLVIGSRAKPDATRAVKALAYRTHMGNTFNTIVQSLLLPGIRDTQCGFKLFKQKVARDIFSAARIDGYAFDVEVLYIAKQRSYRIEELAINWSNVAGSKINILVDSARMLAEVMKIKLNSSMGYYRTPPVVVKAPASETKEKVTAP